MAKSMEDANIDIPHLTLQSLWREIKHVRELMESNLDGLEEKIQVRITDIEKAIELEHQDNVRVPTEIQKAVGNLENLHNEKFASVDNQFVGVQNQFADRDKRTDLALQSQKELVAQQNISAAQAAAKQEASFSKQIEQLGILQQTNYGAANDKIAAFDSRLTRIESRGEGRKDFWGWIVGAIGLLAAIIGVVLALK